MRTFIFSFCLFCFKNVCYSQGLNNTTLSIGDTVPNLSLLIHEGYSLTSRHLNDFKGKMILLDYWATTCPPCIIGLSSMVNLQRRFKDRIQVIVYTPDSESSIKALWKKLHGVIPEKVIEDADSLAFITSDSVLNKLFKTRTYGLKVWIDSNLVLREVTYAESANEKNIQAFLDGRNLHLANYKALHESVARESWLTKRIQFSDHFLSFSLLTKHDEDFLGVGQFFNGQFDVDPLTKKINGLTMVNATMIQLYEMAYFHKSEPYYKVQIDTQDWQRYYPPESTDSFQEWQLNNTFCYSVKVGVIEQIDAFDKMKNALRGYFGFEATIEKRDVKCIVLKMASTSDKIRSSGGPRSYKIVAGYDSRKLVIRNEPMSVLLYEIDNSYSSNTIPPEPCIDDTNYSDDIDITLPWGSLGTRIAFSDLRKYLSDYGLNVVEELRKMDVLVLRRSALSGRRSP